jgi:hypothetical protein
MDDDTGALRKLHDELAGRGWKVRLTGEVLRVSNPDVDLNDEIVCRGGQFRWPWTVTPIGLVDDVPGVAERIMHVLRAVIA